MRRGNTTHGKWNTGTRKSWSAMMNRCYRNSGGSYARYGAVGITVHERWHTFLNFYEDMGERPLGMTLDRIDPEKGYEPGNCRWATPSEQAVGRRTTRFVTFNGKTQCLKHWAKELGMSYLKLYKRVIYYGWSIEEAFAAK